MPGDPKECRAQARRCTDLAAMATDSTLKKALSDLAISWAKLADELDRVHELRRKRPPASRGKPPPRDRGAGEQNDMALARVKKIVRDIHDIAANKQIDAIKKIADDLRRDGEEGAKKKGSRD